MVCITVANPYQPINLEVAILGNCKRLDVYMALARPVETRQVKHHAAEAMWSGRVIPNWDICCWDWWAFREKQNEN